MDVVDALLDALGILAQLFLFFCIFAYQRVDVVDALLDIFSLLLYCFFFFFFLACVREGEREREREREREKERKQKLTCCTVRPVTSYHEFVLI